MGIGVMSGKPAHDIDRDARAHVVIWDKIEASICRAWLKIDMPQLSDQQWNQFCNIIESDLKAVLADADTRSDRDTVSD